MDKTKTKIKFLKELDKYSYNERIIILKDLIGLYKAENYLGLSKHDLKIIKL